MTSSRDLKHILPDILGGPDLPAALAALEQYPPAKLLSPLLSLLLARDPLLGHRAVCALGTTVSRLADLDMEQARDFMRRLMWSLNEESGAVGWGIPETMGEILARHEGMARQYHRILASYVHEGDGEGIFLDHDALRRGAYWGLARLAQIRPELVTIAVPDLIKACAGPDPQSRGLAALALGRLDANQAAQALTRITNDPAAFDLYADGHQTRVTVGELATQALARYDI